MSHLVVESYITMQYANWDLTRLTYVVARCL
jgi:hypothetical protein